MEATMTWDAIVVGAGPAGSVAASQLASAGLRVLILDRAEFPRDKACGDAVPPRGLQLMRELGVELPVTFAEKMIFVSPRGRSVTFRRAPGLDGGVVRRSILDAALLGVAVGRGAVHRTSAVAGLLRGKHGEVVGVTTAHGHEHAPIVLGADGATSIVARELGGSRSPSRCHSLAIRGYIEAPNQAPGVFHLHFFADEQPAYGWWFPTGDGRANVGVFVRRSVYTKRRVPLPAMLAEYLRRPELQSFAGGNTVTELSSWQLPLFDPDKPRIFDGALLAGDAGGFINPITGAGIYEAMATGQAAARIIQAALAAGDPSRRGLAGYDDAWQASLGKQLRVGRVAQTTLTRAPWMMDLLFPAVAAMGPLRCKLSGGLFAPAMTNETND
jgi:geranylgeranyl reductase family protein